MKDFSVFVNRGKGGAEAFAGKIEKYLKDRSFSCGIFFKESELAAAAGSRCLITLGGDGTMIRAARGLGGADVPILGVNLGNMGYMTQVGAADPAEDWLDVLCTGSFHTEKRMLLSGETAGGGRRKSGTALNEVVIGRSGAMKPIHFSLYVNGSFLNSYTADGMIVCTPTGSTAYNLSAGGPIVSPEASLMVLTPICSHALNARSIVLMGDDEVEISLEEGDEAVAAFDGEQGILLGHGERLKIKRAGHPVAFVRLKEVSFLDNLRSKMRTV